MAQPPDPATSSDAPARQLAHEVFALGFPLVLMDAIRRAHPLAATGFRRFPPAAEALVPGLFNDDPDCLHTSAVVDLGTGPAALHLPNTHGRYISVTLIDSFGQAFASLGSRTDDHLAGDIVLAGPGWEESGRESLRTLHAPSNCVWAVSRIVARSGPDRAAVEAFAAEQGFAFASRGQPDGGPLSRRDALDLASVQHLAQIEPQAFFHRLLHLVDRAPEPVRARLGPLLDERLAALGRSGRSGEILSRGFADGWEAIRQAHAATLARPVRDWTAAPATVPADAEPVEHAAAMLAALGAPRREDILTLRCNADESGRPLTGDEQYRLVLPPERLPPALSAWRLTAPPRSGEAAGDVIGDHSPLITAADGSLELLVQKAPPIPPPQVNWLRAPAGPFELRLRLYAPAPAALDGTWRMAAVERLGSRTERGAARPARRGTGPPPGLIRNFAPPHWSMCA